MVTVAFPRIGWAYPDRLNAGENGVWQTRSRAGVRTGAEAGGPTAERGSGEMGAAKRAVDCRCAVSRLDADTGSLRSCLGPAGNVGASFVLRSLRDIDPDGEPRAGDEVMDVPPEERGVPGGSDAVQWFRRWWRPRVGVDGSLRSRTISNSSRVGFLSSSSSSMSSIVDRVEDKGRGI